jgi:hypothetical protein
MVHRESPIDHLKRNISAILSMYDEKVVVAAILRALDKIQTDPEYLEWYLDDHEGLPSAGNDSGPHTMIWGALTRCCMKAERAWKESSQEEEA